MKVYLMQHALAYSSQEDQERPLSPEGIDQAKAAAKGIKRLGLTFDLIVASPKRRAHQTAALIAEGVRFPHSDILTTEAVLPQSQPQELLDLLQKELPQSSVLVVGHMPQLGELSSQLLQGGEILFENAGLACFEISSSHPAQLKFLLTAQQLAA
jgi:phosphohistidine phosphatase